MIERTAVALGVLAVVLAGCATRHQMYDWGDYDPALYSYYKNPAKSSEFSESLASVISTADSEHTAVPPGIYAEFGYLRLEQGRKQEAIVLFEKEKTHWPESKIFMDRMIQMASADAAGVSPRSVEK
jgi:hypothetical protein